MKTTEGELFFRIYHDKNHVIINFDIPVTLLELSSKKARELANALVAHADMITYSERIV